MNSVAASPGALMKRTGAWFWSLLRDRCVAVCRCLAFCVLVVAGLGPVLTAAIVVVAVADVLRALGGERAQGPLLGANGHGPLVLLLALGSLFYVRALANLTRRLAGAWCGTVIARPYRPLPAGRETELGIRLKWLVNDPASWRDLLWLVVDACGGCVVVAAPPAMVAYGLLFAVSRRSVGNAAPGNHDVRALAIGLAVAVAGLWLAPRALAVYGLLARTMLGPTGGTLMSQVRHLEQTRSETIDAGAAELRRIERDLHDGAQARLVAVGMTLDAAGQLLDRDPAAVRSLLAEARESSARALAELRDLVRGIHPPILADRGLAEAIRALSLDLPLPAQFASDLTGRPPAAVESAAYFGVSELLANVTKHAGASRVWIDIRHTGGMLRIGVSDDGSGGADPAAGTGLRGIERRLTAFDGVLALSSPPGGPTVANLEIPCALSSPKTSSC